MSTPKQVEVKDPISGEKRLVTIDRAGHTEEKLIVALADPNIPRDQKDFAVSMYLYERGAESQSMIVDLFRYKGQHTKETRVFKSQIRFDFEMFVNSFTKYLKKQSVLLEAASGVEVIDELQGYDDWRELPNNESGTLHDYLLSKHDERTVALIELTVLSKEEALELSENVRKMADARTRDKGKGIYVDRTGRPYTVDDPQVDEAIKADREATKAEEHD